MRMHSIVCSTCLHRSSIDSHGSFGYLMVVGIYGYAQHTYNSELLLYASTNSERTSEHARLRMRIKRRIGGCMRNRYKTAAYALLYSLLRAYARHARATIRIYYILFCIFICVYKMCACLRRAALPSLSTSPSSSRSLCVCRRFAYHVRAEFVRDVHTWCRRHCGCCVAHDVRFYGLFGVSIRSLHTRCKRYCSL